MGMAQTELQKRQLSEVLNSPKLLQLAIEFELAANAGKYNKPIDRNTLVLLDHIVRGQKPGPSQPSLIEKYWISAGFVNMALSTMKAGSHFRMYVERLVEGKNVTKQQRKDFHLILFQIAKGLNNVYTGVR